MTLQERLDSGGVVILDGAMGTELERRGVPMHHLAWSAAALATHPQVIREIHEDNIRAGAEVIITNTFGSSRVVLGATELAEEVPALNRRAVELAQAAREAAAERPVWIAGSLSGVIAGGAIEWPAAAAVRASYDEQAGILAEAGADFLVLEMMVDSDHALAAAEAAAATGLAVWVGFSCKLDDDGAVIMSSRRGAEAFAGLIGLALAVGGALAAVMHSDVEVTAPALDVLRAHWPGPIAAYPHSGHFVMPNWQFDQVISPEAYLAEAKGWVAQGARAIGGCCGIGPEHIRLLSENL